MCRLGFGGRRVKVALIFVSAWYSGHVCVFVLVAEHHSVWQSTVHEMYLHVVFRVLFSRHAFSLYCDVRFGGNAWK